jgi:methylmalonyl-CoA mutase C-terminal domain/subunit
MSRERIALALMGIDQHENGAVAIARVLREAQMQVDYYGKFNTPASVAERAIAQDVDVIGISCHSWEFSQLVPQLLEEMRNRGSDIPIVIGGSILTSEDRRKLIESGVAAAFTGSSESLDVIDQLRELAKARRRRTVRA